MKSRGERVLVNRAREIVQVEAQAVAALADQFDDALAEVLDQLLHCEGHVLVTGAGTSCAVAQRMAHLLSCCGTPALFMHAADSLHGSAGAVTSKDVVYAISKGGHSTEVNRFVEIARQRGAYTIAQTEDLTSPLAELVDAAFEVKTGEGVDPYGMIATGSSLVNSAATDVLCTLLLELRNYSREAFGETHPEGAVGRRIHSASQRS